MDVRDFIDMTLKEIVAGIRKAQASEGGEAINAEMGDVSVSGNLISTKGAGLFTRVDFDVAVSAEGTGRAGGSLTVFGVGVKAGGESKSGYANRILFSVPVRLPDAKPKLTLGRGAGGKRRGRTAPPSR
jgi:hypothetical protein